MKPRTCLIWIGVCLALMALTWFCRCASTSPSDAALKTAALSYATYEELKPLVARAIIDIQAKEEAGPLSSDDLARKARLQVLALILDDYRKLHNIYCQLVQQWQNVDGKKAKTAGDMLEIVGIEKNVSGKRVVMRDTLAKILELTSMLRIPINPVTMP